MINGLIEQAAEDVISSLRAELRKMEGLSDEQREQLVIAFSPQIVERCRAAIETGWLSLHPTH